MAISLSGIILLVILLILANLGTLVVVGAQGLYNSSQLADSNFCNNSCNFTSEDKRGVPTGSNPLHNRMQDKPSPENLVSLLETQLPRSPECPGGCQQVECGICYGQCLPIDDEHGTKSGSDTEYTCENTNCSRVLHSMCLVGWLHSITITTQSFNFPFGNRPYV